MTNKPESAAVEAVAWLVTNGGECCEPWLVYERSEVEALPASCIADPLYPQSALDALRGEVERQKQAFYEIEARWVDQLERADAAERRVADLVAAVSKVKFTKMGEAFVASAGDIADLSIAIAALTKVTP